MRPGRKTGKKWASDLIPQLWKLGVAQWEDRNKALHGTPLAEDLAGAMSLDISLQVEWVLGKDDLPLHVRQTFPSSLENLLAQSLLGKKYWFMLVRAHREVVGNGIEDDFSPKKSQLRKWVGL